MPEDTWRLISTLCREVAENQNVALQITLFHTGMLINLYPYGEDEEYDEYEDEP